MSILQRNTALKFNTLLPSLACSKADGAINKKENDNQIHLLNL
jgi:hypothetical protein